MIIENTLLHLTMLGSKQKPLFLYTLKMVVGEVDETNCAILSLL